MAQSSFLAFSQPKRRTTTSLVGPPYFGAPGRHQYSTTIELFNFPKDALTAGKIDRYLSPVPQANHA
jgi:hypothetical protein